MGCVHQNNWEWWLRLVLTPGVSAAAQRRLLAAGGPPESALRLPERELAKVVGDAYAKALVAGPDRHQLQRSLRWLAEGGHWLLTMADTAYPKPLLEIADPPIALFASGQAEALTRPCVAVVGSRNATQQGREDAFAFASTLSRSGLCIVSGLALGIDGAAHRGGLDGRAGSIAVVGNGLDRIYPSAHEPLARQLERSGLLLSEHAPGEPPRSHHFPRRNRLISGLCMGVVVVEAAERSGSLVTARMALEQGRDVFALPGSIHSPVSRGCHALIKQGAALVDSPNDVLVALGCEAGCATPPADAQLGADDMLSFLGASPSSVDALIARSGRSPQEILARLANLEVAGLIERLAGGLYRRLHRRPEARGIE